MSYIETLPRRARQNNRALTKIIKNYVYSPIFKYVFCLFIFSLINVYSIYGVKSAIYQVFIFGIGITFGTIVSNINIHNLKNASIPFYIITIILLLLTLLVGAKLNGARRWLHIAHFSLQPAELVKPALIMITALYLELRQKPLSKKEFNLIDLFIPLILTLLPVALILKQPDLGTGIICFLIVASILLFMGIEKKTFICIIIGAIIFSWFGWHHLKNYQRERVLTFISDDIDYNGKGYQAHQAILAFGSGGLWGRGVGRGLETQNAYLPEASSDYALSAIGEEQGFVAIGAILLLTVGLIFSIMRAATLAHNTFAVVFGVGAAFWIGWQSILNTLVNLGAIPIVGVPMPIVSAGGTSLIILLTFLGVLTKIEKRR